MPINNLTRKSNALYLVWLLLTVIVFDATARPDSNSLLVELKECSAQTFLFSTLPRVTFSNDICIIEATNVTAEYPMENVLRISIVGIDNGQASTVDAQECVTIDFGNDNFAVIRGLAPRDFVNVYD